MKICGIITEYNPFHNGHALHLEKSRRLTGCDGIIACMSGNFTQRGEPVVYDKFVRTKAALINGADLVAELPVFFASQSAEYFASYGVRLLEAAGIVDYLCFGSESGDISALSSAARALAFENAELSGKIKEFLRAGRSFPAARSLALADVFSELKPVLDTPNNILGVEYIKALIKISSAIAPVTIKREHSQYHDRDINGGISSATAVRAAIKSGDFGAVGISVPANCLGLYKNQKPVFLDDFSDFLHFRLRTLAPREISDIFEIKEGIENKILAAAENETLSQIALAVQSRRYPLAAVRRMLLNIILDIRKTDMERCFHQNIPYIRVLGFRKNSGVLPYLVKNSSVPVILGAKEADSLSKTGRMMLMKEIQSADIYDYIRGQRKTGAEYRSPVVTV